MNDYEKTRLGFREIQKTSKILTFYLFKINLIRLTSYSYPSKSYFIHKIIIYVLTSVTLDPGCSDILGDYKQCFRHQKKQNSGVLQA